MEHDEHIAYKPPSIESMIVFLPNGKGLTFYNVEILVDDVNLFIFTYASRRNNEMKRAKFQQQNIIGYCVPQMEEG